MKLDWTGILKEILRDTGKKLGHKVNPDPATGEKSQFLLDLVWWKNADDMDIVLAVESEWGSKDHVAHDFGKLLVVKAPLKLMVFEKQKEDMVEIIKERYMQRYAHHVEGEYYLFLEFDTHNKEVHSFHFQVPSSGKLDAVCFRRSQI